MNTVQHRLSSILWVALMLLSSCATRNSTRLPLPAEVTMNEEAGRGGDLKLELHLESGEKFTCIVDTGSPATMVDKSLEPRLGESVGGVYMGTLVAGDFKPNSMFMASKLYLGTTPLKGGRFIQTHDFKKGPAILGMDTLSHYCIQLDFPARKVRFLDPDKLATKNLGRAFGIRLSDGHLRLLADQEFMGVRSWVIDTGCPPDGFVATDAFKHALQTQHVVPVMTQLNGQLTHIACFPELKFGGNVYSNLLITERSVSLLGVNILGLNFLSRNLVTFNFPKHVMYLKQVTSGPTDPSGYFSIQACAFLEDLRKEGRLPGSSFGKCEIDWQCADNDSTNYPVLRPVTVQAGGWVDVTSKIRALVATNGAAAVLVDNDLAGTDPSPSFVDQLRVEYHAGRQQTIEVAEYQTITLPVGAEVINAVYGDWKGDRPDRDSKTGKLSRWRDVTEKLKSLVGNGGKALFVDNDLAGRDPAPFTRKRLRVEFRVPAGRQVMQAAQRETLTLPADAQVDAAFYGTWEGEVPDSSQPAHDDSTWHYNVVKETETSPWKLQKAWRTGADKRVVQEYAVP